MSSLAFGTRVLVMSLLWLIPTFAHADKAIFGPPKAEAVEFKPARLVNPIELLPIEINGKWGYADRRGDVLIKPQYEWADYFYGPFELQSGDPDNRYVRWIARYVSQGKLGWIGVYKRVRQSGDSVRANDIKYLDDTSGSADRVSDGYTVIGYKRKNNTFTYHVWELESDWLNQVYYTGALRMVDGFAAVQREGRCGYIDKRGKEVIPATFAEVRSFYDGLAAARETRAGGGAWGFLDKRGKFRFRDQVGEIQELRSYHNGKAAVKARDLWGFMDKGQKVRVKPIYDEVRDFSGGFAAVRRGTEWGFINVAGKEIAWGYEGAWYFDDDTRSGSDRGTSNIRTATMGLYKQNGLYGYVGRRGRVEIEPRLKNALPFFRGVARVSCGDGFAYIDAKGRPIWDPRRISNNGILGLNVDPPVAVIWPGLPQPDGTWGEPYPFELDVEDHLPLKLPSPHERLISGASKVTERPVDTQQEAVQSKSDDESDNTEPTEVKPKKRIRHVR